MSEDPAQRSYWRVGHTGAPLAFVPLEICEYSHRFDDLRHRFRTLYVAELAETCLRETLADFRPKLSTIRFYDGVAAIRFPSHLDGNPCIAVFEGRGALHLEGAIVALTDPPPQQLVAVAAAWHLTLAPSPSTTEPA